MSGRTARLEQEESRPLAWQASVLHYFSLAGFFSLATLPIPFSFSLHTLFVVFFCLPACISNPILYIFFFCVFVLSFKIHKRQSDLRMTSATARACC